MLLKLDNTSGQQTLQISHNMMQWSVVNTVFRIDPRKHQNCARIGSCNQLFFKVNMELCSELHSFIRDKTHFWSRISHASNEFKMNMNNNEREIPEDQLEEYALKLDATDSACRSKAKAKTQRRERAGSSPKIVSIGRRNWIEPGKYSFSEYEVSKKVAYLLRHSQQMHREEDGAVHFWRMKENPQNQFTHTLFMGLTVGGKYA